MQPAAEELRLAHDRLHAGAALPRAPVRHDVEVDHRGPAQAEVEKRLGPAADAARRERQEPGAVPAERRACSHLQIEQQIGGGSRARGTGAEEREHPRQRASREREKRSPAYAAKLSSHRGQSSVPPM